MTVASPLYPSLSPTKADGAYDALRRAIVVGEIEADSPLDDAELAARYGVGRTPVREALKRLAMEEFIRWPPRRTPYVRDLSLHDVHRLYESRLLIEVPAARLAAERITEAQLAEVARISELLPEVAARGEVYESVELDHALHLAITRAADNRFLADAVRHLNCGSLRLWYLAHQHLGLADVPAEHSGIVEALRTRDPARAEAAVREHILLSHSNQMRVQSLPADSFRGASA
jgi:GntR family transcriptional regulator, rspAB operon transcriptional repressor